MDNKPADSLEDADPQDLLVSLLSTTSSYICNIEASDDAEGILKDSLKSAFGTINKLLTGSVVEGMTMNEARELHLSDSPVRSAVQYKAIDCDITLFTFPCVFLSLCTATSLNI